MPSDLALVVALTVAPGQNEAFEAYEQRAAGIMARYGGRIERRVRLDPTADGPTEIHVVTFPSPSAFEEYKGDAATVALSSERAAVIERTIIWHGRDAVPFVGAGAV